LFTFQDIIKVNEKSIELDENFKTIDIKVDLIWTFVEFQIVGGF
jgi:hypothetical protein